MPFNMPETLSIESSTLHIALATYPKNQAQQYITSIKSSYDAFKKSFEKNFVNNKVESPKKDTSNNTYLPLVYHIFGSYDVAFISVIDSYKFAQKVFTSNEELNPNSYQILTGLCPKINDKFDLNKMYDHNKDKLFVNICNIKLNNGFLIGNGLDFFDSVIRFIDTKIKGIKKSSENDVCYDYIILKSFSWCEICLVLFDDDASAIGKIINELRNTTINELGLDGDKLTQILNNSLYQNHNTDVTILKNSHIFSDTHSYLGVHYEKFTERKIDFSKVKLETEIEYMVKPGHIGDLLEELESIKDSSGTAIFQKEKASFITGKSDYIIPEQEKTSFENNQKLFSKVREDGSKIFDYVRGIKTKPLLEFEHPKPNTEKGVLNFGEYLKGLSVSQDKIREIDTQLKQIKISRPIRQKISKVLFNYNHGIYDPVMMLYALDFKVLIKMLENFIKDSSENLAIEKLSPISKEVKENERTLQKILDTFEEGFHVRMLNCYEFEEFFDFDLDLNTSLSQLLTVYNSLITEVNNVFTPNYEHSQVVQINLKSTVSNSYSVNYNVYHLSLPEFVFFTVTKEVFNPMPDFEVTKDLFSQIESLIKNDVVLKYYTQQDFLDIEYLINDILRVIYVCNFDLKLHDYWLWTDALQTSHQFDSFGNYKEKSFKVMLSRIMLLSKFFDKNHSNTLTCPIPELANYWHKWFFKLEKKEDGIIGQIYERMGKVKNQDGQTLLKLIIEFCQTAVNKANYKEGLSNDFIREYPTKCTTPDDIDIQVNKVVRNSHFNDIFDRLTGLLKNQVAFHCTFSEDIENGNTVLYGSGKNKFIPKQCFVFGLSYSYLKTIFDINSGKIHFLRRNWADGTIHPYFKENDERLYTIDPMGGVFFLKKENAEKYYKMRNGILESLWHFAFVTKKEFITEILPPIHEQEKYN
jgi:hypothetical protein